MSDPYFGVTIRRMEEEPRPVWGADLSTIGIVGPAPGASASDFPYDTPVLVRTNQSLLIAKLGTQGYLRDALEGIADQLGEMQRAARCVVVRTHMPTGGAGGGGASPLNEILASIIGKSTDRTGMYALLKASPTVGFTPRLIIIPGYTGQTAIGDSVGRVEQISAGAGYVPGQTYNLDVSGGGSPTTPMTATVLAGPTGTLGEATITAAGEGYSSPPILTVEAPVPVTGYQGLWNAATNTPDLTAVTPADGDFWVVSFAGTAPTAMAGVGDVVMEVDDRVTWDDANSEFTHEVDAPVPERITAEYAAHLSVVANPVCTALPSLLNELFAHAIVESSGISEADDLDWRQSLQHERLIPISGGCRVFDTETATVVTRPLAPRIAGIAVRRDHERGAPFHSFANQPVQGLVGPGREIDFSLLDGENEGQELLKRGLGVLIRGEAGSDFSIAAGGFVFVGTDNASEDELWRMYNMTRGRDYIHLGLLRALRFYLGRFNITSQLVQCLLNVMSFFLRDLQADEHILGYRVMFAADKNSAEDIRLGHITIGFKAEEPPVLRRITTESARFREAISIMVSNLERQLGIAA